MKIPGLCSIVIFGLMATLTAGAADAADPGATEAEKAFGITLVSLRPTAAGQMLDLRFKVLDPDKAKPVLDKGSKAYLTDAASGKMLPIPVTKAGPMRQTTLKPEAGRVYFMLFSNPGQLVKEGSRVNLVVGSFRKDGIVVDSSGTPASPVKALTPGPAPGS